MNSKKIGWIIKEWRFHLHENQTQFASRVQRTLRTIVAWETGEIEKIPIEWIANRLGVSVEEFLAGPNAGDGAGSSKEEWSFGEVFHDSHQTIMLFMLTDIDGDLSTARICGFALPKQILRKDELRDHCHVRVDRDCKVNGENIRGQALILLSPEKITSIIY